MNPDTGVSIFREIVAQHERSGADEATILEGIDYREKMAVTDPDLRIGLASLAAVRLIERRGERWFVAHGIASELPRTRKGTISIASEAWRQFAKRRIEPYFRPSKKEL